MTTTLDERVAACRSESDLRALTAPDGRLVYAVHWDVIARSASPALLAQSDIMRDMRQCGEYAHRLLLERSDCPVALREALMRDIWTRVSTPGAAPDTFGVTVLARAVERGHLPVGHTLRTELDALVFGAPRREARALTSVRGRAAGVVLGDRALTEAQLLWIAARYPDVGVQVATHPRATALVWRAVVSTIARHDVGPFVELGTPLDDAETLAELQRHKASDLRDALEWSLIRRPPDQRAPWLARLLRVDPALALRHQRGVRLSPQELVDALQSARSDVREAAMIMGTKTPPRRRSGGPVP